MIAEAEVSRIKENIGNVVEWIKQDQFEYGEWGRSELNEGEIRTLEDSKEHPNVFSSVYAANTLRILDVDSFEDCDNRMCAWQNELRDIEGYWVSEIAKTMPFGRKKFSGLRNIRHTAKGLDYFLQTNRFSIADDNPIILKLLETQNKDGGFAQFQGRESEIWTTAYLINLMIMLQAPEHISHLKKRGEDEKVVEYRLNFKIRTAIAWILQKRNRYGVWGEKGDEYEGVTFGLLVQIAPWLVINSPSDYLEIVKCIEKNIQIERKYTWQYLLMIGFYLYSEDKQKGILDIMKGKQESFENIEKIDLIEVLAYGWVQYFKDAPDLLRYMNELNRGHELIMPLALREKNDSEIKTEYFDWCVKQYNKYVENGEKKAVYASDLVGKTKLWGYCYGLFEQFKFNIEKKEDWELLWDKDGKHKGETGVQKVFWSYINARSDRRVKAARELDTGRGRIDFVFSNGEEETILVEFKLWENSSLRNGRAMSQIYQYLKSMKLDTAYLIVFDFDDRDRQEKLNALQMEIKKFRMKHSDLFIELIYIDASRKKSASKLSACE